MTKPLVMKFMLQLHKPPKCPERKCGQEDQAEQTWTSHQDMSLDERNSVASDALENQRRSLLNEATAEHQMRKIMCICNNITRVFNATCQKFNKTS